MVPLNGRGRLLRRILPIGSVAVVPSPLSPSRWRSPKPAFVVGGLRRGRLGGAADGSGDGDVIRLLWAGVDCGSR